MRPALLALLVAAGGCAQHCEWTPMVEESSWARADGRIMGADRDDSFEDAVVEPTSEGVARVRFEIVSGDPATNGLEMHVWSLPRGRGEHPIEASVILPDGARIETVGSAVFDDYAETTRQNPNDAYTSGGTVTAVQVAGTMNLAGDNGDIVVEMELAFEIEEELQRECFDCPGFEGCDY